jgi:hypothetical protein
MKSTAEQLPIIQYAGNHLVVKAYAGCGKTTTLVAYAEQHRHLRMLYLATTAPSATRARPSSPATSPARPPTSWPGPASAGAISTSWATSA